MYNKNAMVDPISTQAQSMIQQALGSGLAHLLRQGPQTGTVLSQPESGRFLFNFQGRSFSLDLAGMDLKPGDSITARLVDGKIVIEPQSGPPENGNSPVSSPARSLGTVLANLGLSGNNTPVLAQAFLQAGIPLDRTALKELAQILPTLGGDSLQTLSFLFSRGLAISPMIVTILNQLFTPHSPLGQTAGNVSSKFKSLDKKLEEDEGDPVLNASQRRRLREAQGLYERTILALGNSSDSQDQPDLEAWLRAALASPENLFQRQGEGIQSLGEAVLRLLKLLLELEPLFSQTLHYPEFQALLKEVKNLHESLSAQTLNNLPPQTQDGTAPIYIQVPYIENGETKQLELRYTPKDRRKKSGKLDLRIDLSSLGPLLIQFQWDQPRLQISLIVQDAAVRDFIQPLLDELREALSRKGFELASLTVQEGAVPETIRPREEEFNFQLSGFDRRV